MKEKIIMLVIGVLIGAIIATGCFLAFSSGKNNSNQMPMDRGSMPEDMSTDGSKMNKKDNGNVTTNTSTNTSTSSNTNT